MKKIKYGPLVYVYAGMDEDDGNFYWTGPPPVGYDSSGVPIDAAGLQCLPVESPLHSAYSPKNFEYNRCLQTELPTLDDFRYWFDENFLIVSDDDLRRYILKWYAYKREKSFRYFELLRDCSSVEEVIGKIWPDVQT
jgi:hypothetical protein